MPNNRRNWLGVLLLLGMMMAVFSQSATRRSLSITVCTIRAMNHYHDNLRSLRNIPPSKQYRIQAGLLCQGDLNRRLAVEDNDVEAAERALQAYSELVETHQQPFLRPQQAEMLILLGNTKAALAIYDTMLAEDSTHFGILEQRAALYQKLGEDDQAMTDYSRLFVQIKNDPSFTPAYRDKILRTIVELGGTVE